MLCVCYSLCELEVSFLSYHCMLYRVIVCGDTSVSVISDYTVKVQTYIYIYFFSVQFYGHMSNHGAIDCFASGLRCGLRISSLVLE